MSTLQGIDGIIGLLAHNPAKTYGPFLFAVLNIAALVQLQAQESRERQ